MIYFTFIGNHDKIGGENYGALLTIFFNFREDIEKVYIFTSPDKPGFSYESEAQKTKRLMESEKVGIDVKIITVDLENPVDFDLVYKVMLDETQKIITEDSLDDIEKIINITSGTPTMTCCWVMLQKSGLIPNSKLIQSFEPKFQQKYGKTCQVVDLNIDDFPKISTPTQEKRELNRTKAELKVLKEEKSTQEVDDAIPDFIGKSTIIRQIKNQIIKGINSDTHVLITGEPGTGKEIVSRAIWKNHRSDEDSELLVFDCGQIESNLIISELFGHERGAFTGATSSKVGIVETSKNKILYLDEIGNIPLEKQNVFMRFIEHGEYKRLGSNVTKKIKNHIIAATNRDINDPEIFKSDLRDRFHEHIHLPPLRNHLEDIPILVDHFLSISGTNTVFKRSIYQEIVKYPWPGNVRQLRHWVERMGRYYKDSVLEWDHIPEEHRPKGLTSSLEDYIFPEFPIELNEYTDQIRNRALEITGGNTAGADRQLGLKNGTMKQWVYQRKKKDS